MYGLEEHEEAAPTAYSEDERDLRLIRCSAGYEEFYYNTSIDMNVFDESFEGCTNEELEVFSEKLTDGYDAVIGIDPRLDHVAFLHTEICDAIPEEIDDSDQARRGLYFVFNYIRESSYFTQGKFNWAGNGQCRWCPPPGGDEDFRSLLRQPSTKNLDDSVPQLRPSARQLVPSIVSFSLYNTKTNRKVLRLQQHHIVDLQVYGSDLDIVAEYNGFSPQSIGFGFDDNPNFSNTGVRGKFALGGGKAVPELRKVGTHTITATSYGEDGSVGFPFELSLLIMDGASNGGYDAESNAMPDTQDRLMAVIADDASFYLSELLNDEYFDDPDSCLHKTLVFMKVELVSVPKEEVTCLKEVNPTFDLSPEELVSEGKDDVCPATKPETSDQCESIGSQCEYGIVCCCGFCSIENVCTCGLNGWRCSTRSYTDCPAECPGMCPAQMLDLCDQGFWGNQHCAVPGHEQLECQRECGGPFLQSGFGSTCSCNDESTWECNKAEFVQACPDLTCPEGQSEGEKCGGYQDVQCGDGLICAGGLDGDCDPIVGGAACIGKCVSANKATPSPTGAPTKEPTTSPTEGQGSSMSNPTNSPTKRPTDKPTKRPTDAPAELRADGCPVDSLILGMVCDAPGLACEYGNQCCCGQCYKEKLCECQEHGDGYHEFTCSSFTLNCDFECTPGACPYYPPQFDSCDPGHYGDKKCPGRDQTRLKCQTQCGQGLEDFGFAHSCGCREDGSWVCEDISCPPDPCPAGQPVGAPCGGVQTLSCGPGLKCANEFGGGICDQLSGLCEGICTDFDESGCPTSAPEKSGRACLQSGTDCLYGELCCCDNCMDALECSCEGPPGAGKLACRRNMFDECPCDD